MTVPRLFLCNGAPRSPLYHQPVERKELELWTHGPRKNVTVQLLDVPKVFEASLDRRLTDLLELASFIFTADCAARRGQGWRGGHLEAWRRDIRLVIPVRDLPFWSSSTIRGSIEQLLGFLTDDLWTLEFVPGARAPHPQQYLAIAGETWPDDRARQVLLFSGGLDSLAGAVECASTGQPLMLVSHRSVPKLSSRQEALAARLRTLYPGQLTHVQVWLNKDKTLGVEHTQRTRSFLYASLATLVAASLSSEGIRFYENGVVSVNLPLSDEVIGARASRTTHPNTLIGLQSIAAAVLGRPFTIDNPFQYSTRVDIVERLSANGAASLIPHTVSCPHTMYVSRQSQHCGTCSQCIDRRIAILAAGLEAHDPASDYVCDVFTGQRRKATEQNIALNYVRLARELAERTPDGIAEQYVYELMKASEAAPEPRGSLLSFASMYYRHGVAVSSQVEKALAASAPAIMAGTLNPHSLLGMIAGRRHTRPQWRDLADRIVSILREGLPRACSTEQPANETRLQELCDALFASCDESLDREFPHVRWGLVWTKPDWSDSPRELFIELKYIRKRADVARAVRDIAEDITKYGDSGQRVLFVVYDPKRLVVDEHRFREPVERHEGMLVEFVR